MNTQAIQESEDARSTPDVGFWKRVLDFWAPVFAVERCLPMWAEKNLAPIDGKTLHLLSGEAYHRERHFHFQRAHSGMIGEHVSPFRGQGMDFAELREYSPGDDIRKFDWQVFARTQIPHIREYREERQLTVWLVLEESAALGLGSAAYRYCPDTDGTQTVLPVSDKRLRAYELLLRLGRIAKSANAKIGFFLAARDGYHVLKPAMGQAQLIRISDLLFSLYSENPRMPQFVKNGKPLSALENLVLKQDWVMAIADASHVNEAWVKPFYRISQHSPLHVFAIQNEREWRVPKPLEGMPLVSPDAVSLRTKLPENANLVAGYDASAVERPLAALASIASVFSVDVDTPIDDVLHQWAGNFHQPSKRRVTRLSVPKPLQEGETS